jgi:hypothetical protein
VIINYPTGLYTDLLPKAEQAGNVTFVISSDPPPRSSQVFLQVPLSEQLKPLPTDTFTKSDHRTKNGELLYTIDEGKQTKPGSSSGTFAIGDVLDFVDESTTDISVTEVPAVIDIQHNTHVPDLSVYGLTPSEISNINKGVEEQKEEIRTNIVQLQSKVSNDKTDLRENQKSINEVQKVIQGAIIALGGSDNEIIAKLQQQEAALLAERQTLSDSINSSNLEIKSLLNDYLDVSRLASTALEGLA